MTLMDLLYAYQLPFLLSIGAAVVYMLIAAFGGKTDDKIGEVSVTTRQAPPTSVPMGNATIPGMSTFGHSVLPQYSLSELPFKDVLVVDDSAVARAKLSKLLESAGFTVTVANDGTQALDILASEHFLMLITDLEMPNMNGFELIAAVQGNLETEDMPIVAITGHEEMQARVHDCQGLYGIFKKPWNDRELLKRVHTLVQMQRQKLEA